MRYLKVIITKYPLFLVLVGAFLLRLVALNQSLWLDEATTARVVQQYNYEQILTQFSPHDFHPPLYYLFMKFWTNIFGYSEIALRLPSVLASLLTGAVIYQTVVKSLRSIKAVGFVKSTAVWAAAFFLFNPLIVYYSQEARMYAFATLFVTVIYWCVANMSRVHKVHKVIKPIILANVFQFLLLVTFYGSAFFIFSLHTYLLFKKQYKTLFLLFPGSIFAALLLHPLFFEQLKNSGEVLKEIPNWSVTLGKANLKNLLLIPIKFTSGRISFEPKIFYYAIVGLWTLFATYILVINKSKKNLFLYVMFLTPIFLGFIVSFYKPLLQYFRFIYVIPFMSILLALGANKKWQRVLLISGFVSFSLIYTYIPSFHREDWKGLVASLPSDTVCALPSSFDPLHYYDPKIVTYDARSRCTGIDEFVFVPYVADIYGFDYAKHFDKKKYSLTETVSFRGVSYEIWQKRP